jgi:SAM-dependent methyltransferase
VGVDGFDLDQVRREIAAEVLARRTSGSVDAVEERRLQRLFEQYSPHAGGVGALSDALRSVNATIFIDPDVPVASSQPAGAAIKKTVRKANYWYMRWVTTQVTKALSNIAGVLHQVGSELDRINRRLDLVSNDTPAVIQLADADAWWHNRASEAVARSKGRVLVAACGDGSFVATLTATGHDAYGTDPRAEVVPTQGDGLDLRREGVIEHLDAVADAMLAGVVLTGVTEAMLPAQRTWLLRALDRVLAADGIVVLHVLKPEFLSGEARPVALELAGVEPLRPSTWVSVLHDRGFGVNLVDGGPDALIIASRGPRSN